MRLLQKTVSQNIKTKSIAFSAKTRLDFWWFKKIFVSLPKI